MLSTLSLPHDAFPCIQVDDLVGLGIKDLDQADPPGGIEKSQPGAPIKWVRRLDLGKDKVL